MVVPAAVNQLRRSFQFNQFKPYFQVIILIAWVNFVAHFWQYQNLGLYEDDHFRFPQYMTNSWPMVWLQIKTFILNPATVQGRPLHESFILLAAYFGAKLGGIDKIYLIAYLLSIINAGLMFVWVKLSTKNTFIALLSCLVFILFPTDTNQIWLTSAFGLRTSLTFLFVALIFYFKGKSSIAYLLMFLSLFCYETIYFIFIFAPLLAPSQADIKSKIKPFIFNLLILIGLFALAIAIRKISGESRVNDLNYVDAIKMGGSQIFLGMGSILRSFPAAINDVFNSQNHQKWPIIAAGLGMGGSYALLLQSTQHKDFRQPLNRPIYHYLLIALGMMIVSYPLNLTVAGDRIEGVYSRVHMGASVGFSLLFACLIYQIFLSLKNYYFRQVTLLLTSLLIFLLINFGYVVQQDYADNWRNQQQFWQTLMPLIADADNGDLVLVEGEALNDRNSKQIRGTDWTTPPILANIFQFPPYELPPPRVYLLANDWQAKTLDRQESFLLTSTNLVASPSHTPIPDRLPITNLKQIILIKSANNQMRRVSSDTVQGIPLNFKSTSAPNLSKLEPGVLFNYFTNQNLK